MSTQNLKNAITAALDQVGRVRTLEIAPELASLGGWTNEFLAGVMMDSNDIILDKEYLLFLRDFFRSTEASQNERKPRFDTLTGDLAIKLRYQPNTVGIKYHSGNTPKNITAILGNDGDAKYAPLVGVVIREDPGPLKAALDSIFSRVHWHTALPVLANRLVNSLLRLWREVLQVWIQPTCKRETSPEFEILHTTRASQAAQAKVRKGSTPIVKIDIEPARPTRTRGIKRSRSVKEESSPPRSGKRKLVLTPPRTPAVEELANERGWPVDRSQFISAFIEGIPQYATPVSQADVDITYTFRRHKFSEHFGSNPQALETAWTRQPPGHKYHTNRPPGAGSEHLIGAQIQYNPYLPLVPSASGLVFRAPGFKSKFGNDTDAPPYPNTVLIQVAQSQWLYLGEYVVTYRRSLPCAEWKSLPPHFKDVWVRHLTGAPGHYDGPQVSPGEMRKSLDDGILKLEVYEMKCVGYHVALQARIIKLGL